MPLIALGRQRLLRGGSGHDLRPRGVLALHQVFGAGDELDERNAPGSLLDAAEAGRHGAEGGGEVLPPIEEPEPLDRWLAGRGGPLLVADERRDGMPIGEAWRAHPDAMLLIGPEGGLTDAERVALAAADAVPVEMGRRILRAETAALLGLAAWQLFAAGDVTRRLALTPPEADT